jgi:ABC-type amino acid transport substrate-binding protein
MNCIDIALVSAVTKRSKQLFSSYVMVGYFALLAALTVGASPILYADDGGQEIIRAGQAGSKGFRDLWHKVLKESGLKVAMIDAPQQRKRMMFANAMIVLDCCSTPEWRILPEEQAVQLFSAPLYETRERYVFKKGNVQEIPTFDDLKKYRVAAVRWKRARVL